MPFISTIMFGSDPDVLVLHGSGCLDVSNLIPNRLFLIPPENEPDCSFSFCFVLFCFVLFCFVLFCFVLFCFVLFCFVLFCYVFGT